MPIHGYPGNIITANPTAPTVSSASGVWTTEQQLQAIAAGNWPTTIPTQQISRSLRFNSADSAYLNRTPASAGNRKTWTWSGWVKFSGSTSDSQLFSTLYNTTTPASTLFKFSGNALVLYSENSGVANINLISSSVYRDPSAWYHVVCAVDTTQATASNRVKMYVNGAQINSFSTSTYPSLNYDTFVNGTSAHGIGGILVNSTWSQFLDGYLTEVNFIDGQALTPSSFGQTNASTGVWEPIAYTGTYGTNGFYLNFSDNSGTTSTTLGKDNSGNGNNWTPNNFSVTAGSNNDSLVDTPTSYGTDTGVGGEVRGNYATLNPLDENISSLSVTLSNGNLQASGTTYGASVYSSTFQVPQSGKWYYEFVYSTLSVVAAVGIRSYSTGSTDVRYQSNGDKSVGGSVSGYGASWTTNDVIGVALNMDSGTITFYKNGVSQGAISIPTPTAIFNTAWNYLTQAASTFNVNFGQRPFAYTAPSGFKALCTQNLPTPTIGATSTTQANDYFNIALYTGNAAARSITGVGFQPDFVWIKTRGSVQNNSLFDAVRGTGKYLWSNLTNAESSSSSGLTAFNSDGFSVGANSDVNENNIAIVAWNWKANGAGVTNTSGTITSTVSANTTSGFSIVTYTGNGSASATVGHGLGVIPQLVIVKNRSVAGYAWWVRHVSLTSGYNVALNSTSAQVQISSGLSGGGVADLSSSTTFGFQIGSSNVDNVNRNTNTYVAYCFAEVAGYSAFGSYTGNGSTDGPFVYLGFKPKYILFKNTAGGASAGVGNWVIMDGVRDPYNVESQYLYANLSNAEGTAGIVDATSNGFKLRAAGSSYNESSATHIYAAFAESPFKYSLAR